MALIALHCWMGSFLSATAALIAAVLSADMQPKNFTELRRMMEPAPSSRISIFSPALTAKITFFVPSPTMALRTSLPLA